MEEQEEKYKKGFNNGYLLAKHEPELLNKIIKERNPENEYFSGLMLGRKEYEREKMKAHLKENDTKENELERE